MLLMKKKNMLKELPQGDLSMTFGQSQGNVWATSSKLVWSVHDFLKLCEDNLKKR